MSGNGDRVNQNESVNDYREGTKSCQNLSEPSQESFYNSSGIDKGYRPPLIHYRRSGTCKVSVKIYSIKTYCVCLSKGKNELSVSNNINHKIKSRINLVDRELELLQWTSFLSAEPTNDFSSRCFPDRVESSLQGGSNNREMVRGGENFVHKCAGTTSNMIGSIFLQQIERSERHTLSDRQQGGLVLPFGNGTNNE